MYYVKSGCAEYGAQVEVHRTAATEPGVVHVLVAESSKHALEVIGEFPELAVGTLGHEGEDGAVTGTCQVVDDNPGIWVPSAPGTPRYSEGVMGAPRPTGGATPRGPQPPSAHTGMGASPLEGSSLQATPPTHFHTGMPPNISMREYHSHAGTLPHGNALPCGNTLSRGNAVELAVGGSSPR